MLEGLTNEEKALAEQIIKNMRGEGKITTNTQTVASQSVTVSSAVIAKKNRFSRAVKRRIQNTSVQLDLLANLSVTSRYAYSQEDANALVKTLEEKVAYIKGLLERGLELQEKRAKKITKISQQKVAEALQQSIEEE